MAKIIIIGGGWSGVSAAIAACNAGASPVLLERTDMLLGTGLVGGIMRNNGRLTATEEAIAMGGNEIFDGNSARFCWSIGKVIIYPDNIFSGEVH